MNIKFSENVSMQVNVTHEMIKDYEECRHLADVKGDKYKDCNNCSLNIDDCKIGLCDIARFVEKLKQQTPKNSWLYSQTKDGYLTQERYSKPLQTATGLIQMVYRNQV